MDFDVPTDLINRAQIGFREAAGLSLFDPNDTTLPSFPTVEASISTLHSSPSNLRCKYCQGNLIRGLQSLICIYCGEYQKKDLLPDPISFNSTNGYSWLLQSLNLSGSERVGSLAEGSGINAGPSPAEDMLTLSELLDLQISWQDEPKKSEYTLDNQTSEQSSSMNADTADVDNFFPEPNRSIASDSAKSSPVVNEDDDQNKTFGAVSKENPTPIGTPDTSTIDDASSEWNAEFQLADNSTKLEDVTPKLAEPFVGAEPDLSAHMDSVFGQMEGFSDQKLNDSDLFTSTGKDWIQDDPFANISSESFQQSEQLDSVQAKVDDNDLDADWFNDANWQKSSSNNKLNINKDDNLFDMIPQNKPNDSSLDWFANNKDDNLFDIKPHANDVKFDNSKKQHSDTTDWFQDNQWSIGASDSTTNIVENKGNDDEFDDWNDFATSTGNQGSFGDSLKNNNNENVVANEKESELNLFPTADPQELDFGDFSQSDLFSSSNKNPNNDQGVYDIFSEASTTSRNVNAEGGNSVEGLKIDEITPDATTHPKNDVEMLLSQMHDLSFMLKSELSIPSKPNDHAPSHS